MMIILFFLILFLIGISFALLTYIPPFQRFLLRSRASRVAGLLVLAMLSFLTGLIITSYSAADASFYVRDAMFNNPDFTSFYASYKGITIDWDWVFQNRSLIIIEFWIQSLIPTLSEGTCFSSNPMVCDYMRLGDWPRAVPLGLVAIVYAMALIPAFITFWFGRRHIRRRKQLATS
jgi:hypothetical protein